MMTLPDIRKRADEIVSRLDAADIGEGEARRLLEELRDLELAAQELHDCNY